MAVGDGHRDTSNAEAVTVGMAQIQLADHHLDLEVALGLQQVVQQRGLGREAALHLLGQHLQVDRQAGGGGVEHHVERFAGISGHRDAQSMYDAHWQDCTLDFETMHFLNGFGNPGGKFRFKPDWQAIGPDIEGMPSLPDYAALTDAATAEHPLRLVTAPARQFLNSSFTVTPGSRQREGRPTILIHPEDAARYRVADGGSVDVGNKLGVVSLHAKFFSGLLPGTVIVESLWGNADFPGGLGINALVSDDPGKPDGGAVFHDTAVWVRPVVARAVA